MDTWSVIVPLMMDNVVKDTNAGEYEILYGDFLPVEHAAVMLGVPVAMIDELHKRGLQKYLLKEPSEFPNGFESYRKSHMMHFLLKLADKHCQPLPFSYARLSEMLKEMAPDYVESFEGPIYHPAFAGE